MFFFFFLGGGGGGGFNQIMKLINMVQQVPANGKFNYFNYTNENI